MTILICGVFNHQKLNMLNLESIFNFAALLVVVLHESRDELNLPKKLNNVAIYRVTCCTYCSARLAKTYLSCIFLNVVLFHVTCETTEVCSKVLSKTLRAIMR